MKTLQGIINNIFNNLGLPLEMGVITLSQRPELSDYQINGALSGAKILKKSPQAIAQMILDQIPESVKEDYEISVTSGFINLKLTDIGLLKLLETSLNVEQKNEKVVVDFSGPNVAKSMHVGHVRSTLIGASLVKIYKYQGSQVTSDNHLGDFGTPLGVVITKIQKTPDFNWTLKEIEKLYIEGAAEYKNPENIDFKKLVLENTVKLQTKDLEICSIWKKVVETTINSLKEDYSKLDIVFDLWKGESYFQDLIPLMIEELKKKGLCEISKGAVVVEIGLESPLVLEKSTGGYLYHTTDLACIKDRLEFDKILYVVDNRQQLHFKQLFLAVEKFGWTTDQKLEHVAFGTINGPDNKPFKTRDGGVLKLSDLIDQAVAKAIEKMGEGDDAKIVGIGALKFAELKHNRLSDYVFDLDKFMAMEGFTGPYIMYSAVRAKSLLAKTNLKGNMGTKIESTHERDLILSLNQFEDYFNKAVKLNEPHHLCEYAFKLANTFNAFYHNHSVVKEPDETIKAHRIALVEKTLQHLTITLDLLGIKVPTQM